VTRFPTIRLLAFAARGLSWRGTQPLGLPIPNGPERGVFHAVRAGFLPAKRVINKGECWNHLSRHIGRVFVTSARQDREC
jgi:hypothetical protein